MTAVVAPKVLPREVVYQIIDGEREYQDSRRINDGSTSSDGSHTPEEFLLYMNDYLQEAMHVASRVWGDGCKPAILDIVRKVTALGVACMEENGAVARA